MSAAEEEIKKKTDQTGQDAEEVSEQTDQAADDAVEEAVNATTNAHPEQESGKSG